jgi:hypothetical protein
VYLLALVVDGGCLSFLVIGIAIFIGIPFIAVQRQAAEKRRMGEKFAAEEQRRQRERAPKPPKPGYCRGCGVYLSEFGKCGSSLRLEVSALEFDPETGKRWYRSDKGMYEWKAFCTERKHTHSVVTGGGYTYCSCIKDFSPKRGGYDFVVHILGPRILDGKYAVLGGTCGQVYCGSCGIAEPTQSKI